MDRPLGEAHRRHRLAGAGGQQREGQGDELLTRNVRQIPYERIHNVALVRNPLHRALDVATVRVETAGGGRPEALLRLLSLKAAEEMRRHTLGESRRGAAPEDAPLVRTPDLELVRLGLISNRGLLVVAAMVGALTQADWWHDWLTDQDWPRFYERDHAPGWLRGVFDSEPAWSASPTCRRSR